MGNTNTKQEKREVTTVAPSDKRQKVEYVTTKPNMEKVMSHADLLPLIMKCLVVESVYVRAVSRTFRAFSRQSEMGEHVTRPSEIFSSISRMQWAQLHGYGNRLMMCYLAASANSLECLKHLRAHGFPCYFEGAATYAIQLGNMPMFRWCIEEDYSEAQYSLSFLTELAYRNEQGTIEWLLDLKNVLWDKDITFLVLAAIEKGHSDLAKWLLGKGVPLEYPILHQAIKYRNEEVAKWCIDHGLSKEREELDSAYHLGDVEAVRFLCDLDYPCDIVTFNRCYRPYKVVKMLNIMREKGKMIPFLCIVEYVQSAHDPYRGSECMKNAIIDWCKAGLRS